VDSRTSVAPDKGEGGGSEVVEPCMLGGVDIGLEGGEVERRRLVLREAKKAVCGQLWWFVAFLSGLVVGMDRWCGCYL